MRRDYTEAWVLVAFVVLAIVLAAAWNEYVHNDWTCMFSHCVRVK